MPKTFKNAPAKGLLPLFLVLAACSPSRPELLQLKPGERGTFLAVGTDTQLSVQPPDASWIFKVKAAQTKDISIGAAVGGDESADPAGAYDETTAFIPASTTKVLTSAIALKELGADFRFATDVTWLPVPDEVGTASNMIVFSDGDPQVSKDDTADGFSRMRIKEIVQQLKAHGVSRIKGEMRFVSSEARKDLPTIIPGTETIDNISCYGALAEGFNYRRNCADVEVLSPVKAAWADKDLDFKLSFQIDLAAKTNLDVKGVTDANGVVSSYLFTGDWNAEHHSDDSFALPISDAKSWFAHALLAELNLESIDASAAEIVFPQLAEVPDLQVERVSVARQSVHVVSDPLSDLLRFMNKPSDDFLADSIFKAIAEHAPFLSGELRDQGIAAYKKAFSAWLSQAGHSDFASDLTIYDGAGLSRANLVTPRAYLGLLKEFAKEPNFQVLWDSLPIAGRDGTLINRMKGTVAEGFVHAKTGTVRGAYQLAGYIPRLGQGGKVLEYVPFVILSAATPANLGTVHAFQDQLVVQLTKTINPQL